MEVKANINVDAAQRVSVSQSKPRRSPPGADSASFSQVAELDQALRATPTVRPTEVVRAKELVSDLKYPPASTIKSIASLLALKLQPDAES